MKARLAILLSCLAALSGFAQGFVNLDFEGARYPLNPVNFYVPTTDALPGWTAYIGGTPVSSVLYNSVNLSDAGVGYHDSGSFIVPYHGFGSATVQSSFSAPFVSAAIGQTGQIPGGSLSIVFYASGPFLDVTFGGQVIPLYDLGLAGSGYHQYAGDISAFAGQTGELRFTTLNSVNSGGKLDFVQFSTTPVPEPSTWALLALGSAAFACLGGRRRNR